MNKINKYFLVILDTVFKYVGLNWTLKHSVDFPKFWHKVCIVLEVKDVNDKDGISFLTLMLLTVGTSSVYADLQLPIRIE